MKKLGKLKSVYVTVVMLIAIMTTNVFEASAATKTWYADYGVTGYSIMSEATRVRYTYDNKKDAKKTTKKGKWTTVESFTCSKTTKKGQSFTLSHAEAITTSVSVNATIPIEVVKGIVPDKAKSFLGGSISVGKTKSNTKTNTCSASGVLYKKGKVAKLQVRYITETTVYTVKCQKQVQKFGKWSNTGKSYTKKITYKNKYPDQRVKY